MTAAGDVTVAAGSGFALIGDAIGGDGAGNVSLVSGGNLVLSTNGADAVAIVGNMGNGSASGAISGNVDITANGTITLTPAGSGAQTLIGNFDAASLLGNVTIKAASLIGNIDPSLSNDLPNGNFTAAFSGNSTLNVEAFSYTSGYTLDVSNGGDILISGALKNSGSGDISLTSGGAFTANAAIKSGGNIALESAAALTVNNAVTAGDAVAMISGGNTIINAAVTAGSGGAGFASGGNIAFNAGVQTSGNGTIAIVAAHDILFGASVQNSGSGGIAVVSGGDVTIGGNSAGGDVFVGSKAGPLTLVADNLLLDAAKGFAQLGYNGAGSGDITVAAAGGVTLDGGAQTGHYAQIGNGGYKTSGDESGDITVAAGGDVTLAGGSGQEAYAQIGHGGAEADKNSSGYTNAGFIAVSGQNVVLAAGAGDAAYAQVGHGGYLLGNGLHGTAINDGDITVAAVDSVTLTGDGADGYAQIGNGGDQLNANASASSGGNNGGDISVTVSSATGAVTMTAGADNNSYVQIGNGGYSSNAPTSADASNFTDSGDIFVSDLGLSGSDTGENGYAQIGNGDSSKHGVGNITGNITIAAGTVTVHNGTAAGASALIGNDTGRGTVSGTVSGYSSGDNSGNGAVSALVQNSTTASNAYLASLTTQTFTPPGTLTDQLGTENGSQGPLESMAGDGDTRDSDKAADSLGDSLNGEHGHTKAATLTSQVIIPGVLRELMLANQFQPRAIPSADQDYSSWGNEALWQW